MVGTRKHGRTHLGLWLLLLASALASGALLGGLEYGDGASPAAARPLAGTRELDRDRVGARAGRGPGPGLDAEAPVPAEPPPAAPGGGGSRDATSPPPGPASDPGTGGPAEPGAGPTGDGGDSRRPGGSHLYSGWDWLDRVPREIESEPGFDPERKAAQLARSADVAAKRGTLVGRIERVDAEAIAGFAYDWEEPLSEVAVEVYVDGRFLGTAPCVELRAALTPVATVAGLTIAFGDVGSPSARRGWSLPSPPVLEDGDGHWVEAFAFRPGSAERCALEGSPFAFGGVEWPVAEVQLASDRLVYGWAVDPTAPEAPVTVEIVVDGEVVGTVRTGGPAANGAAFEKARALAPPERFAVDLDAPEHAWAEGSYARFLAGTRPYLSVHPGPLDASDHLADEYTFFRSSQSRVEPPPTVYTALKLTAIGPDAQAFLFEAPADRPLRGALVQVLVASADGSRKREAGRSPLGLSAGRTATEGLPRGDITFVSEVQISGWALDPDVVPRPIQVDVFVDGAYQGRLPADRRFAALVHIPGIAEPEHAFIFVPRPEHLDGKVHSIQVFAVNEPAGVNPELNRSPAFFVGQRNAAPIGFFDGLSDTEAVGWAYDPNLGSRPTEVEVWIDGELSARAPADEVRPDLVPIVSAEPEHGFHVPVPAELLGDGRFHTVRVFAVDFPEGSKHELALSPRERNADRPYLGVAVEGGHPAGLRVVAVDAASPAETAGIRAEDVILAFDDREAVALDAAAFSEWLLTKEPGETVVLRVLRAADASEATVAIPLGG